MGEKLAKSVLTATWENAHNAFVNIEIKTEAG